MIVDRFFASQLREGPLRVAVNQYSCREFSARERPNFIADLDEIETNVAPELRTTVTDVYGDDWLRPYRAVIEDHRKREARRSPPTA